MKTSTGMQFSLNCDETQKSFMWGNFVVTFRPRMRMELDSLGVTPRFDSINS